MASLRESLSADLRLLTRGHPSRSKRFGLICTNRGFHAILLYRLSHAMWQRRIPALPAIFTRIAQHLFAIDISPIADLGPGIVIVHGFGVVIGSDTKIEGDCCIYHGVTFGDRGSEWIGSDREDGHPRVEAGCMFGAGAKVLGPVRIGRNCVIGANAVVLSDLPACSIAAGVPARIIGTRPEMDENLRPVKSNLISAVPVTSSET